MAADRATPGTVHLAGPAVVAVDPSGTTATTVGYERVQDGPGDPSSVAYVRHRLALDGDGWRRAATERVPTGSPAGAAFLRGGLEPALDGEVPPRPDDVVLSRLTDLAGVRSVLAAYGLAADAGAAELVGRLYTEDTAIDVEGRTFTGRAGAEAMITDPQHQAILPWSAHTMGPGLVTLDGDRAVSTHWARTYCRLPVEGTDRLRERALWRIGVNRWELVREGDGRWRIARRTSRSTAHPEHVELLARALGEHRAAPRVAAPPPGPTADGPRVADAAHRADALAAQDVAVAATMALGAPVPTEALAGFFAPDTTVEVDGVRRPPRPALLHLAAPGTTYLAAVPTPGVVEVDGDEATVEQALLRYAAGEGGPMGVLVWGRARWDLRRTAPGGPWTVAAGRIR